MKKITALDWINNSINSNDLYESDITLGLNKHAKKKFGDVDAIDNATMIQFKDPVVEMICHEHGVHTIGDAANVTDITGWFSLSYPKNIKDEF